MESQFVTGRAKNLIEFAQRARAKTPDLPAFHHSLVTYHRDPNTKPSSNPFIAAAGQAGMPVDVICEKGRFDIAVLPQIAAALERLKMRLYNQLDRWSLPAAARVATVCGAFKHLLESRGVDASRITVRHNAIRPFDPICAERVEAVRRALGCDASTPFLLMVSRLSHEKGHVDFLEALALLKHRGVNCHALIVGEGPERGRIERSLRRLRLIDAVTLVGQQNDVRPYFAVATLYVMPSHSEGSPLALLEAMAARVPAVASNAGGIPEIVTSGRHALLVPARAPQALADAIEHLLRNPQEGARLAENALLETNRFMGEEYHRGLVGIYQRVLDQSPGT
jgi:glycosyltransferase involved in cell wall biosynthesis